MRSITRRSVLAMAAAAGCAQVLHAAPARAQIMKTIRVIAFPGGGNGWPIWVAQRQGFFADVRLIVELTPTPGSVYQMTHLIAGDFDIAHTAMDNVVAYTEGEGEVAIAGETSLVAIMGGDDGFLHVLARPQYASYADLRGKRLGVDALTTGFAFVLRSMLERNGLHAGDYELVAVGAGARRYAALVAGEIDGTISSTPLDVMGEAAGLRVLGSATATLGHYQGYVGATTRAWTTNYGDSWGRAYVRAYGRVLAWLYDAANQRDAIALLVENAKYPPAVAEKTYGIMINRSGGYEPRAVIDLQGVATVIGLREKYGSSRKRFGAPEAYVDANALRRS